jgi:tetratricopeptide (TPR) repeat protein
MNRRLNGRFLVIFLGASLLLVGGGHFLHAYQVQRNAGTLLERAGQAESDGDLAKALNYFSRYLGFRPDDIDAKARYGLILAKLSRSRLERERAFLVLESVLRDAHERADARRRAGDLAMDLGRLADAKVHYEELNRTRQDPELLELLGRCEEGEGHFKEASQLYKKAIEIAPDQVDSYVRLARMYRRDLNQAEDGDAVMKRLTANNPNSFRARLASARYLREQGLLGAASEDLAYAREKIAPEEADVLLASADQTQAEKNVPQARAYLEKGLKLHSQDPRFHLALATLELRSGHRDRAVEVLRHALQVLPDKLDDIWAATTLFIEAREPAEARPLIERLERAGTSPAAVDYLRARLMMTEGNFGRAAALLERCRNELTRLPELALQADLLLAQCYTSLEKPDQRLAACRRALQVDPTSLPARWSFADALWAVGDAGQALVEFRSLTKPAPEACLAVVRILMWQNANRPEKQRDWSEAKRLLADAPQEVKQTTDYRLLTVDLLLAQGQRDAARTAIQEARDRDPKEVRYWITLASFAAADEKLEDAFSILGKAEGQLGNVVELPLARAVLLARRKGRQDVAALTGLETQIDRFSDSDRNRLVLGLAEAYERVGSTPNAERLLRQAAEKTPNNLGIRVRLFELIAAEADIAKLEQVVDDLREVEGKDEGTFWRYGDALRHVLLGRERTDPGEYKYARDRLKEVAKLRPEWVRVPLLEAQIEDEQGNIDAAIEKYGLAIKLGARQVDVLRRAVQLLASRRRSDEAQQLLDLLKERTAVPAEVGKLDTELSLLRHEPAEQSVRRAEQAVKKDSQDYRDYLWLGLIYSSTDRPREAEDAFRRAVSLNDNVAETWVTLVGFLAGANKPKEAKAEIENAKAKLPAEQLPLALAPCYEAVGDRPEAEKQYLALFQKHPDDEGLLRSFAVFYLRSGDAAKAEPLLLKMSARGGVGSPEPAIWARRTLALTWAASGNYKRNTDALRKLDENLRDRSGSPEDLRARALVLALRPGGRRQSIQSLEESFLRLRPTPEEEFLLAQLYEADGNWAKAKERMLGLLTARGGDKPILLAYYVRALLQHNETDQAAEWLDRLERKELERKEAGTARTVELKARLLQKRGQGAEAARLVREYAQQTHKDRGSPNILRSAGLLLQELGLVADAEELLKQYVAATEAKNPANALVLADFLARQNRVPEALGVCEKALAKVNPEQVAQVCVGVMRMGEPRPEDFRRAEELIERAIAAAPNSLDLLVSRADLRDAQGRYDEAIELYRSVLRGNSQHPLALNNLAWLLALHVKRAAEGLALVEQAISISGPVANLLDTRGVIRVMLGQGQQAVDDFREAIDQAPSPVLYFHLAQAHHLANDLPETQKAMRKAQQLGLQTKDLHALERQDYLRLLDLAPTMP